MSYRTLRNRRLPVAPGKPYPPFCHIHECRMAFRRKQWRCPAKESDGWRCKVACTDEQARNYTAEIL